MGGVACTAVLRDGWCYHEEFGISSAWAVGLHILAFSVVLPAAYNVTRRSVLVVALFHTMSNMASAIFGGDPGPARDEFLVAATVLAGFALVALTRMPRKLASASDRPMTAPFVPKAA